MEREELLKRIRSLEQEHNELNEMLDDPECSKDLSTFDLRKLKKRKLSVKDKIKKLNSLLYPNIIA